DGGCRQVLGLVRNRQCAVKACIVIGAERAHLVDRLRVGVVQHEVQAMRRALTERELQRVEVGVAVEVRGVADAAELRERGVIADGAVRGVVGLRTAVGILRGEAKDSLYRRQVRSGIFGGQQVSIAGAEATGRGTA